MIKKDRIFELTIEEDDDISGIDSVSLVSEPAIEISWLAFNRECKDGCHLNHDFSSDDEKYVEHLMTNAETEEDLFNDGWVIDSFETITGKEDFVSTNPNAPSFEDTKEYKVRYKYVLNPLIKGDAIISTSRQFCRQLIAQNKVFRIEDIENATNDYGQSPLVYRNSWNCRHVWQKIKYKKDAVIVNKASINKGKVEEDGGYNDQTNPDYRVLGFPQQNTATDKTKDNPSPRSLRTLGGMLNQGKVLNLSKENMEIDESNVNVFGYHTRYFAVCPKAQELFRHLVTMPMDEDTMGMVRSAARAADNVFKIELEVIKSGFATLHQYEEAVISVDDIEDIMETVDERIGMEHDISFMYNHIEIIKDYLKDELGYDTSTLPAYTDQVQTGKTENFESYSDYPEGAKNNAKRAIDWAEKNGWGDCLTPVGKARANQLAKGEPISEETISRMASFARHAENKDVPYSEGCGGIAWDAWGGTSGIEWAQNKLERIRKEKMSKQMFATTDEEKRIVIGPAMVPNQKIIRKDKITGEPYYVFFSPETIKMIADKYMKNQYTRNNDTEHDGKAIEDIYVTESWIVEDEKYDKSRKYGFDVSVGSWMLAMKIPKTPKGEEVWQKVKSGELNGFSVSGYFAEEQVFSKEELFLFKLAEILK